MSSRRRSAYGGADQRALERSILVGTAVAAGGFGSLYVLWSLGDWRPSTPGLFDYRSATWGDGILLPVTSAALTYAASQLPAAKDEGRSNILVAAVCATVGASSQVAWLLDPNPQLNWTLPAPHRLNVAGMYHAAFLTAMSGTVGMLSCMALRRLRNARAVHASRQQVLRAVYSISLATAGGLGFCYLLVADLRSGVMPRPKHGQE